MAELVYIADLEKHWLEAESKADRLKDEAARTGSQEIRARHREAEQAASEAFDRLWVARDGRRGGHAMEAR